MIRSKTLKQVEAELTESEKIFDQARKRLKKARGKVQKDNQKRALHGIGLVVEALDDQKEIIESGGVIPAT